MSFANMDELRALCTKLPMGDDKAAGLVMERQNSLTKPIGSLGRLEDLVAWLARWQGRPTPCLDHIDIVVFAGSHGITRRGVSAYGAEVTGQMVANFAAGGAAINQLAKINDARLKIVPLSIERPTGDFTTGAAMSKAEFVDAVRTGYEALDPACDLLAVGEMGIGNTTIASAICFALFGGSAGQWAGRGTGVDDRGLARKVEVIDEAFRAHEQNLSDPLALFRLLGGRELAAIFGATLAARINHVPVIVDGFVATAALAPFYKLNDLALEHVVSGHVSSEYAHRQLLEQIGLSPLLDLGLRLGEASGAALAIPILRAALACHTGMASFDEAGVTKDKRE